ncbi:MaoC family dehydratase N-terminal domain-containing protein [Nocardia beijingensis]|uniref:fused (3R)-hydroxyacyl-ACP dehydratase subunits HadA/HadB n=1 Tax=Nocardia beijingensis TaxID=95162 RepID=UPI001895C2E9|nr:fused (3R)-hydroxyacyl-ACP dehydratase subunits HadA/HadB [Nocardia beijingensis]MBF6468295.1 MaoC family dehydratase N-terminal domain-containing protein [Nocardia beijingensis]
MFPRPAVATGHGVSDHYEVGREKIREFARAVQDAHPAHWDDSSAAALGHRGLVAPITFASAVGSLAQRSQMRAALDGYDPAHLLHVDQDIRCHRPVVAGDRLTHEVIVDSRRSTPSGDLIAVTTVIRDAMANPVQTVHTTLAGRARELAPTVRAVAMLDLPAPAPAQASARPAPRAVRSSSLATEANAGVAVPGLTVGRRFPRRVFRLSRGELVHYAGVSGDVNPIHWSDEAARHAGLRMVTAHGMLTMGLGATCLSEWLGVADGVVGYYVRFASPVPVAPDSLAEISIGGVVRSVDDATGRATISLTAQCDDVAVFAGATATVRTR